jgi:hypothetical protein
MKNQTQTDKKDVTSLIWGVRNQKPLMPKHPVAYTHHEGKHTPDWLRCPVSHGLKEGLVLWHGRTDQVEEGLYFPMRQDTKHSTIR